MGFCPQFDALWPDMTGRFVLAAAVMLMILTRMLESTFMCTVGSKECLPT